MAKYILDGEPAEVAKVIQENRLRVERGVITLTPVQPETATVDSDTKDAPAAAPKKTRSKQSE